MRRSHQGCISWPSSTRSQTLVKGSPLDRDTGTLLQSNQCLKPCACADSASRRHDLEMIFGPPRSSTTTSQQAPKPTETAATNSNTKHRGRSSINTQQWNTDGVADPRVRACVAQECMHSTWVWFRGCRSTGLSLINNNCNCQPTTAVRNFHLTGEQRPPPTERADRGKGAHRLTLCNTKRLRHSDL